MKKIGIFGAHGTGKTTLANDLANEYDPWIQVTLIQEIARECPYPVNQEMTIQSQHWILLEQCCAEQRAQMQGADVAICDRTVLDPIVYAIWAAQQIPPRRSDTLQDWRHWLAVFMPMVLNWMNNYYDELYFCRPDGTPPAADGFRATDPDFQRAIDNLFYQHVDTCCFPNLQIVINGRRYNHDR